MIAIAPVDLEGHGLFAGLSSQQIQLVSTFSERLTVEKGAAILEQGRPSIALYSLVQGKVGLEAQAPKPNGGSTEPVLVAVLGSGDSFGWSSLVEPHVLTLSAVAMDRCILIRVEAPALREAMQRYRDLGWVVMYNLSRLLAQRLAQTQQALIYERGWALVG